MNETHELLEVELEAGAFLVVKESLTRIGIAREDTKTLYQSCHILHKRGRYYIVHFKEMFALDGKPSTITETDIFRRDQIARLLEDWGLLRIVKPEVLRLNHAPFKVLRSEEKPDWLLVSKYTIGNQKRS